MSNISIIDFGKFIHGSNEDKQRVAHKLDDAFHRVGFAYLKNHDVPSNMVRECFTWSKKFFDLPLSTKMLAPHPPGGHHHRGYSAPGVEKVTQHVFDADELSKLREIPDYKESFESGNPTDATQPNIWPPDHVLPGFHAFLQTYFETCTSLLHTLLDAISLSLALPSPGLSPTHAQSLFQLRLLHYPPTPFSALRNNQLSRINAHSDFGSLTLLFQDNVGGLEIEDLQHPGVFHAVEPMEECVLVNVGDLLERWSNGRWRSCVHRVELPVRFKEEGDDGEGPKEEVVVPPRYSIPFFAMPDPETVIEALPGCWEEGRPKFFERVTAGEYVRMRMEALYDG
ncbi:thymine dioxygenase [Pyrenophora tritici-repentis]|uniref:Non-hem dioxygenase in morphine synthesis N-terminal n=1 Tax=Pyrenophora tritici-repentis TaxID=45151 RepID=A0A2W1DBG1_9PLEO|nr:thymine dioxygenase [Pyrenophora tritici-repentis]KAF7445249.1 thymine dioxygenase [Pyrenophora tritici-repentis]KAF7565513.1 thymine dioxygenase [Pyrenophora tritici-repentis]KAI0584660.1 thymine dioxygenase [Pyrenophora tritici-repentis]KAI0590052.1 thymine dioxygenase [Pyrenophora tritici-repentis]